MKVSPAFISLLTFEVKVFKEVLTHTSQNLFYKWTKISSLEINIFEINHISLICLEFFILKFTEPLQSYCCPVKKKSAKDQALVSLFALSPINELILLCIMQESCEIFKFINKDSNYKLAKSSSCAVIYVITCKEKLGNNQHGSKQIAP